MRHTVNPNRYPTLPAIHFHDLYIFSKFRPRPSGSFEIAEDTSVVKMYLHRPREVFYITDFNWLRLLSRNADHPRQEALI